jgi:dihydropteroate synthase
MHTEHSLALKGREPLRLGGRALVMGILNVTPDSFSDGGRFDRIDAAVAQARLMVAEGADIIDIGGESTRPGATPVGVQEELDRVLPVIDGIRAAGIDVPISIDTSKPLVADQAIDAGALIINDVHGLQGDPDMVAVAATHRVPVIAMHWDRNRSADEPLLSSMQRYFARSIALAEAAGIERGQIVLDPGFGFGKTLAENYGLLGKLRDACGDLPILVGISRKSMIGKVLGNEPAERLAGTLATSVLGYMGGGHIFRVHDVRANRDALRIAEATLYGPDKEAVTA